MRRSYFILLLVITGCSAPTPSTYTTDATDVDIPTPAFTLTERHGQKVSSTELRGQVWVASFVFTRCTGPCPQVTGTMTRLQSELKLADEPNLRFVTFTVDPERDTPTELLDYAQKFRAHEQKWLFLTGNEEQMHRLLKEGFKVSAQRSPMPKPGEEFDHSSRIIVVDQQGSIRGFFDGIRREKGQQVEQEFTANLEALKALVRKLLNE